jgi:glycosyltransferase involved in cell wall biosynthesis
MRILAFFFHFPPMSGGGPIVSFEIVNTLATMGHKITVLTPDVIWTGQKYQPKIHENVRVIRVETPSKNNLKVAARRCKDNLQKIGEQIGKETKFDFVFTIFHPFHLVPNAAVSCAKKLGIPIIVKVDDAIYEKSSGIKSIQRRIEKIYALRSLQGATKILVANQGTREIVSEFYKIPKEKLVIIPNGIDVLLFKKSHVRKHIVVFSGVMYYHRGLDVLLDAIPSVLEYVKDAKFILLGDGQEMPKLKKIVSETGIESSVEFKGWIDREEIPSHLGEASIGIGPLKLTTVTSQALPIKVLEYMASSLPIIAKRGTLPEDVLQDGKNGYFIDESKDLSGRIVELLKNPELVNNMGKASFDMVQKFSWENIVKSILEIVRIN